MLNYSDVDIPLKEIAVFYAKKVGRKKPEEFFKGAFSLTNSDEALEVARAFWEMAELASTDHLNNTSIFEGEDLEFWMHKLFNKVYGYYEKHGFKEQWIIAETEFS